jgi:hypothetical protein
MSRRLSEKKALTQLQRAKSSYQSFIKLKYEHAAKDCKTCPTRGECCTDEHFVNVHITRLEAVAIRDTLLRSPRLNVAKRRAIHERAQDAVERFNLSAKGDTSAQTYSCPLYEPSVGCLVHRRAKPAPCVQHACYDNWRDLPPATLQSRTEHRVEQLNSDVYGAEWEWLPIPLWLTLIDPESDGEELERLAERWRTRPVKNGRHHQQDSQKMARGSRKRASLPVINRPC